MWGLKRWFVWTALPFIVLGAIFMFIGARADPEAKTDDGHSLKWFWYIMGAWFIGLTVLVYLGIFIFVGRSGRKADRLKTLGRAGKATVLSSGATGSELNNMPGVEMRLRVDLDGVPSYELTHHEFVNPVNLAFLQAGARIPVVVDPENNRNLMVDWSSAGRGRPLPGE